MKKKFRHNRKLTCKSIVFGAVSLLLVSLLAVSGTISWIEDVSQVEFNTNDDSQQTPVHIGGKTLKSDAVMKSQTGTVDVNLDNYFNKSGDMHLSPCYGNGDDFYFPVEKKAGTGSVTYRNGTKDDANVNYLSTTFRVVSEGAPTAYWFEKTNASTNFVTFKDGGASGSTISAQQQYLRCSVTVDGTTNVYALNTNGQFKTVINGSTVSTQTGRRFDQYTYYTEAFNNSSPEGYYKNSANVTNKPNQGAGSNLNGNTLFTVNTYDSSNKNTVKTVTVKLWLEYNSSGISAADIASVNINFVSSWAKTRRIYVKDSTVHQEGYSQAKWLSHNGTSNVGAGLLYWCLLDNPSVNWKMTRVSTTSDFYYVDIPAVYNNAPAKLSRRSNSTGWGATTEWDSWSTVFPNTFHSEVYTVYSKQFGTWEPAENVHAVYFANSAFFSNVYDYMWDSASVHGSGINDKVVKNAEWPGLQMLTKMATKTSSQSLDTYVFFYNSDYDRIIFNDGDYHTGVNQEYQTQDLWLTNSSGNPLNIVNGTFDMTTLTWFHTNPSESHWSSKMPTYSTSYIHGNFSTNDQWKDTRFAYGGEYYSTSGDAMNNTTSGNMICKVYIKNAGDYQFVVYYNGKCYKTWTGDNGGHENLYAGNSVDMYEQGGNNTFNVVAKSLSKGVYRFYLTPLNDGGIRITLSAGEAHTTT